MLGIRISISRKKLVMNKNMRNFPKHMKKIIFLLFASIVLSGCCTTNVCSVCMKPHSCCCEEPNIHGRKIAVQAYTFRKFTLEQTLEQLNSAGIKYIECYPGQKLSDKYPDVKVGPKMNAEQRAYLKDLFKKYDITMISFGVTTPLEEADIAAAVEFTKEMGGTQVQTEALYRQLSVWEKYSKLHGVGVGIHHHAIDSKVNHYYRPEVVSDMLDRFRVNSTPDIGHWARSGLSPVSCLRVLKGKFPHSMHFKDIDKVGRVSGVKCVDLGEGALDMEGILAELDSQGFEGYFVIENEDVGENPLPAVKQAASYLKSH